MWQEIINKAEEWTKKICICCKCYTDKDKNVALIFPPLGQKLVFISESPYNFGHKCEAKESKTLEDFLKHDLLKELKSSANSDPEGKSEDAPRNIFDFLYKTFRPVFSDISSKEDVEKFLRTVYWTHIAKRTLRGLKGYRGKYAKTCSKQTKKELEEICPKLIVIASSIALRILLNRGYKESFRKQIEEIRKNGRLLTVKELISEKGRPLLSKDMIRISDIEDCEVAVFPNPSPKANKWKKEAYEENKPSIEKVLKFIHSMLQNNQL